MNVSAVELARTDLISAEYESQLREMHRANAFAAGGNKHIRQILHLMGKAQVRSVLDYGCGHVDLARYLRGFRVRSYDPAVVGRDELPEAADLVVCTDVLEHIEPDKLDTVLNHIFSLTLKVCFVVIAIRPAEKRLPDGRNAHLIIDNAAWWAQQLRKFNWICTVQKLTTDEVTLWMRKQGV